MKGRIALKNGDSSELKSVTEDSLFRLLMLNHQYLEIVDAPVIGADLNIEAKSVEISGNCATCLMSGMEYYKIHLCKDGNKWKIKGENGIYATSEMITKAKKKLDDYKIFLIAKPGIDSVLTVVNNFFKNANQYFKSNDPETLRETCDNASIDFIQRLYSYAKSRSGLDVIITEMEKPNYLTGDVTFNDNRAVFKFYNEETTILLQRTETSFIVTGFNGIDSKNINDRIMNEQYVNLLRSLKSLRQEQYRNKLIK